MSRRTRRRGGYSLIEVALAVSFLGVILSAGALVSRQGLQIMETTQQDSDVESRARRVADRLVRELQNSGSMVPVPAPVQVSDFQFKIVTGLTADGDPEQSGFRRLFLRTAQGELDDGIDNDGDGLIDEGELVLVREVGTAAERSVVLCRGIPELLEGEILNGADDNGNGLIDEPGFSVVREEDLLVIRLSVAGSSAKGKTSVRTLETGVRYRD